MSNFEIPKQFDGTQPEIPAAEQNLLGKAFSAYVDDILLTNIEYTVTSPVDQVTTLLLTTRQQGEAGFTLSVDNDSEGRDYLKKISVRATDTKGMGGDAIAYRLGTDGIVRRVDLPKITDEQEALDLQQGLMLDDSPSLETSLKEEFEKIFKVALIGLQHIATERKNFQLAQQMGLNNQPIGFAEFERLKELLDTARPRKA